VRNLVTDAAVLGTTFPAEALIAVSRQDEVAVRTGLAELLRREVFSVSADPLSPERGSYQFAQQMLRQVAYDTLSRRDRKTRHLAVAAHLATAFPGEGEEVTDVIARHYLDALDAVPGDPDTAEIRQRAIAALVRAAERADRTGAPRRAATAYATAAGLTQTENPDSQADAGTLWERAAEAALGNADYAEATEHAGQARDHYLARGEHRAAARAQATAGETLQMWGHHAEAREQLTEALEVLRAEPDTDTVRALGQLATLEVFAGSPGAEQITAEAITLGQALAVGTTRLALLFTIRGVCLYMAGRQIEAVAYLTQAVQLATQAGDNALLGRVLLNMSELLAGTDPAAAAEAGRTAAAHLRRAGARAMLAAATANLIQALLLLGDWDVADDVLGQAVESDGLGDIELLVSYRGWLAALRGDAGTAETVLAGLTELRASDDVQDKSVVTIVEAFAAAARGEQEEALRYARLTLSYAPALGNGFESVRWAWPLAARVAYGLGDARAVGELLAFLDAQPPGHVIPLLRAERDLARARLADSSGSADASALFAAAITSLREHGTPYHLAHGLLDHAGHLLRAGDATAAARAIAEARDIGIRLRCPPLLDRTAQNAPVKPATR
jgi:tetratricopeptide (TPR) repeat protein